MDRQTDFTFYSILKGEDAEPYVGNSLLVAADGLGGAGSAVHTVAWEKFGDPARSFYEAAFGDFQENSGMENELKEWMQLATDGKPHTSALWASRIVIARFIYAMTHIDSFRFGDLSEERLREKLSEFIGKGLERTARRFSLTVGKYGSQLLLPTTLAAIKYAETDKDVTAEAIWAGDSRCYALTKDGVQPLSGDDEDASGAITNLFYVGERDAKLHYKKVTLPKPCALFAVSDGTFDPFEPHDHFGLEYMLLSAMSDCHSVEELRTRLQSDYEKIHADDATMAFAACGFTDYESMQCYFGERALYIEEVWKDLCARKDELEVKNSSVEEAAGYIRSRTSDKFDAIAKTLLSRHAEGKQDICLTPQVTQAVEEAKRTAAQALQKATEAQREANLAKLRDAVYRYRENPGEILRSPQNFHWYVRLSDKAYAKLKEIYDAILNTAKIIRKKKKHLPFYEQKKAERVRTDAEELAVEIDKLHETVSRLMETQQVASLMPAVKESLGTLRTSVMRAESEQKKRTDECTAWGESLKRAEADLDARLDEYLAWTMRSPVYTKALFKSKFLIECGWKEIEPKTKEELNEEAARTALLLLRTKKTETVDSIADSLALHYGESSAIDEFYNATRLQRFRSCCRLHRDPDPFLEDLERQIRALEEEYRQPNDEEN